MKTAAGRGVFAVLGVFLLLAISAGSQSTNGEGASSGSYVGATFDGSSVYHEFKGMKLNVTPHTVGGGGDVVFQYSNGSYSSAETDVAVRFQDNGASAGVFKVLREVTRTEYALECLNETKFDSFNNTFYNDSTCFSVPVSNVTSKEWVNLNPKTEVVGADTYAFVTVYSGEVVKASMPVIISDKTFKYSVVTKPSSEGWLSMNRVVVDPVLNGVQFSNSSNFSIKLNAAPDLNPVPSYFPVHSINITGIPEKNANSTDIRIVDSLGRNVCFGVLSSTASSAEIVPLVNFTSAGENKTFIFYWGNSTVTAYDNSCPNGMNFQLLAGSYVHIPEAKVSFQFAKSNINEVNYSGTEKAGTNLLDTYDNGVAALQGSTGSHNLTIDGNVVKAVTLHNGGKNATAYFYAFNNFTMVKGWSGFGAGASDGFFTGAHNGVSSADTTFYRNSGKSFTEQAGGTLQDAYGMVAMGDTTPSAFDSYVWWNDSFASVYPNGRDTYCFTRDGFNDPQCSIGAGTHVGNWRWDLSNFSRVYLGFIAEIPTQAEMNWTYAFHNASWSWTFVSQTAVGGGAGTANEAEGDAAILTGIESSVPPASRYASQQVYVVNSSNTQWKGTVDYLVVQNSPQRRWLLNYITAGESYLNTVNLSSTVYVLEISNKTMQNITQEMSAFINATK